MPYFISKNREGCETGFAVVDEAGAVIGCHMNKQDAIAQAVAVSLATDEPFEGERAAVGSLAVGDYVQWIADFEAYFGEVYELKGLTADVKIYNDEDGIFIESMLIANVPVADLTKIADLPTDEPDVEDRVLPDNYRPALAADVPKGRACGNCFFFDESRLNADGDKAWCERWDAFVDGGYYCNGWQADVEDRAPAPAKDQVTGSDENEPGSAKGAGGDIELDAATETGLRNKVAAHNEDMAGEAEWKRTTFGQLAAVYRRGAGAFSVSHRPGMTRGQWAMARVNAYLYLLRNGRPENAAYVTDFDLLPEGHPKSTRATEPVTTRAIDQEAPAYMRAAARRGLEYYEQGLAGDGLVDATVRDARLMAAGTVSDEKWIRIAAWIARHLGDLDSPDADPSSDNYPSPGVVAHLLWGSGATRRAAERTQAYAESVVARIRAEQERDLMMTDTRAKWASVASAIVDRLEGRAKPQHEERVNVIELEVRDNGDGMTFEGYAAVFNSESEDLGGFREFIAPGAFKRSLQSRNEVKLLWNHDAGEPLASVRGGTLKLYEDNRGLKVEARLADTSRGRDVAELIRSKTIDSMSFGFSVIKDTWNADGNVRTLNAVRLFEISMVSFPAYNATAGTVSIRSAQTIDADQLADALFKLESGEELDPAAAGLITEVVAKLTKTEEVQAVDGDILALKKKKLDLLMKELNVD